MCGVFYIDDAAAGEIEKIARKIDGKQAAAGDIYPSRPALILRADGEETVSEVLKWGYEAYGRKTLIFNARAESVRERPMFRKDFEVRRCLIPANGFYEWKHIDKKHKEKYEFYVPGGILFLAGIYHKDPAGDRFAVLTREAEGCMKEVHDRMPLILRKQDMRDWLFSEDEAVRMLDARFEELEKSRSDEGYRQMSLF